MSIGASLDEEKYAAWQKVWANDALRDKMIGGRYGPDDNLLRCSATVPAMDEATKDADVIHCAYLIGELMRQPDRKLNKQELVWGGANDWADQTCRVRAVPDDFKQWQSLSNDCTWTYAEIATAIGLINFSCMKEYNLKGKTRFSVKGEHLLRGSRDGCRARVVGQ